MHVSSWACALYLLAASVPCVMPSAFRVVSHALCMCLPGLGGNPSDNRIHCFTAEVHRGQQAKGMET